MNQAAILEKATDPADLPYDCAVLGSMSVLLEHNGETQIETLRTKLHAMGVNLDDSSRHIREDLVEQELVEVEGYQVTATKRGFDYVRGKIDFIEGTCLYQSASPQQRKLPPAVYRILTLCEDFAGPDGWIMDKRNTRISPIEFTAETLDMGMSSTTRKIGELRTDGSVESDPEKAYGGQFITNLRLSNHGKARLAALRLRFPDQIAELEHGSNEDINLTKLSETDLQARILAVDEEVNHMSRILKRPYESTMGELVGLSKDELVAALNGLTETLHALENELDS